jgi:hypothetical protein
MPMRAAALLILATALTFIAGCATASPILAPSPIHQETASRPAEGKTATLPPATPTATLTPVRTPQPRLTPGTLGIDLRQFPADVNPLTGLRVQNPSLLSLPAVLVSISNMPVTARPQAGTSFASWIFELFIGEGTSRFMGVFYGDLPRRIPNAVGGCALPTAHASDRSAPWVGSRVWLDENRDGRQDPWEAGVADVCINLFDANSGTLLQSTGTDSNGYFAFNVTPGNSYQLQFVPPPAYSFTSPNIGNDDEDSDADPATGRTPAFTVTGTDSSWDAGLVLQKQVPPTYSPSDIAHDRTYVGPIRSGRLTYNEFYNMFPASCLVYASAGDGIRQLLHGCEIVFGEHPTESPNTALLDTSQLLQLAQQSKIPNQPVNYSGNLFSEAAPGGGLPGTSLWTFIHAYTQAFWQYDPISGAYLRQTDDADGKGFFHPDTDRLTGRQLAFDNVIVMMADYQVVRHIQYDVDLHFGLEGYAFAFRDGQMYKIRWSTANRDWEKQTGLLRPIHFIGTDRQPFPLKPGHTWITIMTIKSAMHDLGQGNWKAFFTMPDDPVPAK